MHCDLHALRIIEETYPKAEPDWQLWAYYLLLSLEVLHWIGLSFHGGLNALLETQRVSESAGNFRFPTVGIIVCDPERASKYVDIGIRVDAGLDIEVPRDMAEAAQRYFEIAALVDDQDGPPTHCEELLESVAACTAEQEKWCLRRELFRHTVKAKYEDILIDKSQDLYLEKLERKRDYLNKLERDIQTAKIKKRRLLKERLEAKFMEKMESIEEGRSSFEEYMVREAHKQDLERYHAYREEKRLDLTQKWPGIEEGELDTPSVHSTTPSED